MIESVIIPRAHDVGGFEVRRALPAQGRQMIGPFIFFDQMGPGEFLTGQGLDVPPHPHIGLSTVTYLWDSLGTAQPIRPGALNWMTAGQGITHSERTASGLRIHSNRLFGIQSWAALPAALEETAPAFAHHPAEALPVIEAEGARLSLIAGEGLGARAPAQTHGALFYADLELAPGGPPALCRTRTRNAAPTWCRAPWRWRVRFSRQGACWFSAPATPWRSAPRRGEHDCCCWAGL